MLVTYTNQGPMGPEFSRLVVDPGFGRPGEFLFTVQPSERNVILDTEQCEHLAELIDSGDAPANPKIIVEG